jgi:hypothetical protein
MDVDTGMPLELSLDQLNGERAILRDGAGNSLTLTRTEWDQRGRPHLLVLPIDVAEPRVVAATMEQVA